MGPGNCVLKSLTWLAVINPPTFKLLMLGVPSHSEETNTDSIQSHSSCLREMKAGFPYGLICASQRFAPSMRLPVVAHVFTSEKDLRWGWKMKTVCEKPGTVEKHRNEVDVHLYIYFLGFIEGLKETVRKQPQVAVTKSCSNEDVWPDSLSKSRRAHMFEQLPLLRTD